METTDQGKELHQDDFISMSEQNAVHLVSPDTYIKYAKQTSVRSAFRVTPTVLDGFFPYEAQMITNMKGCVTLVLDLHLQGHSMLTL